MDSINSADPLVEGSDKFETVLFRTQHSDYITKVVKQAQNLHWKLGYQGPAAQDKSDEDSQSESNQGIDSNDEMSEDEDDDDSDGDDMLYASLGQEGISL